MCSSVLGPPFNGRSFSNKARSHGTSNAAGDGSHRSKPACHARTYEETRLHTTDSITRSFVNAV